MEALILSGMFHPDISILEKIVRPVIVYFFLVIGLRLAGKRELAQLNPFDLVVLLTLSNTVQNAIIGNDNSVTGGLIGATTLLVVNYIVVRFLFKHERLAGLVEGDSDVLIEQGKIKHDRLKKERITLSELESAAHKQGFASLDEVDRAVLEPGGTFSFMGKKPSPEAERHSQVLARLDQIQSELAALREGQKS
ncbi:MAG: YetF domain-containing protein [Blastocatellia bacterium]